MGVMDGTTIVLGVVAVLGCGAAIWLAIGRARLSAEAAGERAGRMAAEGQREAERAERERVVAQLDQMRESHAKASGERIRLDGELAAEKEQHQTTRQTLSEQARRDIEATEERLQAEIAHVEEIAREKLESVEREKRAIKEQLAEFDQQLQKAFGHLAAQALQTNSTEFLKLAGQAMEAKAKQAEGDLGKRQVALDEQSKAILSVLQKTDEKLTAIEKDRIGAYSGLTEQVRAMLETSQGLRTETGRLVQALRKPEVRGRWGEIQLERVVEIAGMKSYCDFATQESNRDAEGRLMRPDMTVRLPNERMLAVDAKTNIAAYMEAIEAPTPETAAAAMDRFARHVSEQVQQLSRKNYWSQFEGSPQFVVMFIPGDQFIDAALQRDEGLIERAAHANVIIASPSTLIGLLKAVVVGWREKQVQEDAQALLKLGRELHQRGAVFLDHLDGLGGALGGAVEKYNKAVGSFQQNLVPTLRRFEQSAKSEKELPEVTEIEVMPRSLDVKRLG